MEYEELLDKYLKLQGTLIERNNQLLKANDMISDLMTNMSGLRHSREDLLDQRDSLREELILLKKKRAFNAT